MMVILKQSIMNRYVSHHISQNINRNPYLMLPRPRRSKMLTLLLINLMLNLMIKTTMKLKHMDTVTSLLEYLPVARVKKIDSKLLKATGHGRGGHCVRVGCVHGVARGLGVHRQQGLIF